MRKLVVAALLVVALAGCTSDDGTDEQPDVNSVDEGIELMRNTVSFRYVAFDTPADMLEYADIALVGEVVSVDLALREQPPEHRGVVVVGLRPSDVWKADSSRSGLANRSDVIYYYFSRPKNVGVDPYREALPEGTEVVLFGHNKTDDPLRDADGHDPEPVKFVESDVKFDTIYSADAQGLFIEAAEDRLVNVWAQELASNEWQIADIGDLRTSLGM